MTCAKTEEGRCVWRYFSPINTNTGNEFYIQIGGSKSKLAKEECYGAMVTYPITDDYTKFIMASDDGKEFSGAIESDKNLVKTIEGCYDKTSKAKLDVTTCIKKMEDNPRKINYTEIITDLRGNKIADDAPKKSNPSLEELEATTAGKQVKNGCLFSHKVDLSLEQKFYGENNKENKKSISGFNFYYRPIDVNNPFPNTLDPYSYWHGLETTIDTTPFKTITYKVSGIDTIKSIRSEVSDTDTKYTSWEGIDKDGSSSFVKKYGLKMSEQSYYKLGCGPSNKDWEVCK